jgi:hypothetical protein
MEHITTIYKEDDLIYVEIDDSDIYEIDEQSIIDLIKEER